MADVVKYGIQIPNRVFVGGIAFDTREDELKCFFQKYGKVKDCKIVFDKEGVSRGFGFVTFESKQEATQTQKLGTVFFNQKKLNLGPAIRQKGVVFNDSTEFPPGQEISPSASPPPSTGLHYHPSGYCYTVAPDGVWYFHGPSLVTGSPTDTSATVAANIPLQFRAPMVASPPAAYDISRSYGGMSHAAGTHYIANPLIQNGGLPRVSHQLSSHPAQSPYTVIENITCQPLPCYPLATSPIYHPQLQPSQLYQVPLIQQDIYRPPHINPQQLNTSVTQPTNHNVNQSITDRNVSMVNATTMPMNIASNPVTVLTKSVQSLSLNEAAYRPPNGLPVVPANQEVCTT